LPVRNSKFNKSVEIYYPEMVNIYGCKIGAGSLATRDIPNNKTFYNKRINYVK
jgi:hypothetical protein